MSGYYLHNETEWEVRPVEKIKPCPICGKSDNVLIHTDKFFNECLEKSENHTACLTMQCYNCNLELYEHFGSTDYDEMRSRLISKWNTRKRAKKEV